MRRPLRVIFLDFDGVINSDPHVDLLPVLLGNFRDRLCRRLEPHLVARVDELADRTGASVVLSTWWRDRAPLPEVVGCLRRLGLRAPVLGRTPARGEHDPAVFVRIAGRPRSLLEHVPRGYEIQQWLDAHPQVESYVILDDMDDMGHLRHRLVQTDPMTGVTLDDVALAQAVLHTPRFQRRSAM